MRASHQNHRLGLCAVRFHYVEGSLVKDTRIIALVVITQGNIFSDHVDALRLVLLKTSIPTVLMTWPSELSILLLRTPQKTPLKLRLSVVVSFMTSMASPMPAQITLIT